MRHQAIKMQSLDIRKLSFGIDAEKSIEKEKLTLSSVSKSLTFFEDDSEVDVAFLLRS